MAYHNIREEELKNKVAQDYFAQFDCSKIIGNIDFCAAVPLEGPRQKNLFEAESLLWAEAKQGTKADIYESFVQLILTIGKARTFDKHLPPAFLGAFDAEKFAFIPYNDIQEVFYQNDFNWKVTPSDHESKEFRQLYNKVQTAIEAGSMLFHFDTDDKELHSFIKQNFVVGKSETSKIKIDKNNFTAIYSKWLTSVQPSINIDWKEAKKNGIFDCDFYLADLLSTENKSLKQKLFVILKVNRYELDREIGKDKIFSSKSAEFKDNQKAHIQFWNKYERPPQEAYWDYIMNRRDLLVPQDVRERKGSYFTPSKWVHMSQKYIADVLGKDWQDEYYVWDCAAGTGNLLAGLVNKYNIWASTLDKPDVDVMHERIDTMNKNSAKGDGANLLHDHVFQFDFLNDEFTKLPQGLQDIINDPEERKKLVIYINPPYAEAGDKKQLSGTGKNKSGTTTENETHKKYSKLIGKASNELFAQFFIRIYSEISGCKLAEFSKLKILQAANFSDFRVLFQAELEKLFLCPANSFDNVTGHFPIGFFLWNLDKKNTFKQINADVFDKEVNAIGQKKIHCYDGIKSLSFFIKTKTQKNETLIGHFAARGNDFQNQNAVFIDNIEKVKTGGGLHITITFNNLKEVAVSFTVRKVIEATWLNDRDQFLYPNDGWETDLEFQGDCLAYTLFNNNIQSKYGTNHWIPFTEEEVDARDKFDSNFMTDFIKGKLKPEKSASLFADEAPATRTTPLEFSSEAKALFDAGRALWRYYHAQPGCNVNASLYDIREYFQGRDEKGKMNTTSEDETYMSLIKKVREQTKLLAKKIEPKVYKYGFLKE